MTTVREEEKRMRKKITKILLCVVLVAALICAGLYGINYLNKEKQSQAIMQLDTNPSIQLVLNAHDKVIAEVAVNADGERLLANTSFIGLKAEVAAERFAKTAAEMDKINDSTTATINPEKSAKVTVTISAENPDEYKKLAENVKTKINEYFGENGIFAGAIVEVNAEIKTALENMGASAKDLAEKTSKELVESAKETANKLNKVAVEHREELNQKLTELYDSMVKSAKEALDKAKAALEEADLSEELKETLQKVYEEAERKYNEMKEKYNNEYAESIKAIEQKSEETLNTLKTQAQEFYTQTKVHLEERVEEFKKLTQEQRDEMKAAIKEFQENLAK